MMLNLRILISVFFIIFIQVGEFDDNLTSIPIQKENTTQLPVLESTEVNKTISDNETSIQNSSISTEPADQDQSSTPLSIINSTESSLESNQSSEPIKNQSSTPLSIVNLTESSPTQSTGYPVGNFNQTLSEKTIADSKTVTSGFFAEPMCVVKRGLWWRSNLKLSPDETWLKKKECSVLYCSADGTLQTYSCVFLNSTLVRRHKADDKINDALEKCHEAHCL